MKIRFPFSTSQSRAQQVFETAFAIKSLLFEVTARSDSAIVDAFYEGYDAAFVLPNEKETRAGFTACLKLNEGRAYRVASTKYGPFCELVLVARDEVGYVVGGANFIAFHHEGELHAKPFITTNLNYIYVTPEYRRRGYLHLLLDAIKHSAVLAIADTQSDLRQVIFLELNDPFLLSGSNSEEDTARSGLDQFERIAVWRSLQAKVIDFAYVQPPLSPDLQADTTLAYAVIGAKDALDACLLRDHLLRFFSISVLKGKNARLEPYARTQLDDLDKRCVAGQAIPILDISSFPQDQHQNKTASGTTGSSSLRSYLNR